MMLHSFVWVYTCQNATLLKLTCRGSYGFYVKIVSDLRFKFGPEITVERHLRSTRKDSEIDFFNMYIRNEDDFSKHTTGLLGKVPFVFARHTLEMV